MSREFGSYMSGYFHSQIEYAAEDLAEGRGELTHLWGEWFREFYDVAYAIANFEASDSGEWDPIMATIKALPTLKKAIAAIEHYLMPYEDVIEATLREKVQEDKGS